MTSCRCQDCLRRAKLVNDKIHSGTEGAREIGGYHHGNLRREIIDAAVAAIGESGAAGWSLRELARRAGVSHAAPAHHFGDRAGVLTAVAAEGLTLFADALEAAGDDLLEMGVAYVEFAVSHRAHFEVMFSPELFHPGDPELAAARHRAGAVLARGVRARAGGEDTGTSALAAWSLAHGFASLWISGALPADLPPSPAQAARPVLRALFPDG